MLESIVKAVLGFVQGLIKAWVNSERLQKLEREKEARSAMSAAEQEKDKAEEAINAVIVEEIPEEAGVEDDLTYLSE